MSSKLRFKIGDRVEIIKSDFENYIKLIGVTGIIESVDDYRYYDYKITLDYNVPNYEHNYTYRKDYMLKLAAISDSKLARRLYKNQIKKIENNLIYLK